MIAGATHKRSALASDWMPEYVYVLGDIAHTYTKLHGWSEDAWVDKHAYCEIKAEVKTVVDAVNELRGSKGLAMQGDRDYNHLVRCLRNHMLWVSTMDCSTDRHAYICTIAEFNQCVEDMAHWHSNTVETEFDNMAYAEYKDFYESPVTRSTYDVDARVSDASKPVYTKEMYEAGELPPAGSECMIIFLGDTNPRFIKCTIMYVTDGVGVANINGSKVAFDNTAKSWNLAEFKPIRTERELAIDAANEMTLHDLATAVIRGNRQPGIHDTVLLERLAKIDKTDKL